jgi:aspartyl-tRNA(Asn)/glutamyl-tRNA(Gln) amidotransferase subunit C
MTKNKTEKPVIDVSYVARLANLELDPLSMKKFQKDMESIVEYVDLLGELDLESLEDIDPTAHLVASNNVWREDIVKESFPRDVMLKNAPDILNDELIRVSQVVSEEG